MQLFSVPRIPHCRQWLTALQVLLVMIVTGTNIGWTCPFMGRLIKENPPFIANKYQISWIASICNLVRPGGNLLGAISNSYFGSKMTLHITLPICLAICAVNLIYATSIEQVYISQIFSGLAFGISFSIYPLYIAEVASNSIRGALTSTVMQGFSFGIVIGNLMGAYLELRVYAIILLLMLLVYVVMFCLFPETPTRHILKNNSEKAVTSLQWYQDDVDAEEKIKILINFMKTKPELKIVKIVKELITCPVNRKVMLILLLAYGLLQFSGMFTILEYSDIIFVHGKVDVLEPATLVVVISAIGIPGCWVAMYTSDRYGRTIMLCCSCLVYAIAVALIGVNFQLLDAGYENTHIQWIIIISSLIFRFSLSVGILGVPMILVSELLAPNVKNVGACTCNVFASLCSFISNKLFQVMVDYMTYKYVFYLLAIITFLLAIYVITCIPETKGKAMEEIQEMLARSVGVSKKDKKNNNNTNACDDIPE